MFKIGRVRIEPGGVILLLLLATISICMWHGHKLSQALDKANHDHSVVPVQKVLPGQECKNVPLEPVTKFNVNKAQHSESKTNTPAVQVKPKPVVSPKIEATRTAVCPALSPVNSMAVSVKTDMTLDAVHFRRNSARLDLDGRKLLLVFAKQLSEQQGREKPSLEVVVEGHADSTGKPDRNMRLSQHRAESVKKLLKEHLPQGSIVTTASQGDTKPSGDNKTYDGREVNRRVELLVVKK
jgi:outer membrane protein OmpA-like peptidoglycan-associated protein